MDSKPTGPRLRVPHCGAFEDYVDASDVVPVPHLSGFLHWDSHGALDGWLGFRTMRRQPSASTPSMLGSPR